MLRDGPMLEDATAAQPVQGEAIVGKRVDRLPEYARMQSQRSRHLGSLGGLILGGGLAPGLAHFCAGSAWQVRLGRFGLAGSAWGWRLCRSPILANIVG
jgi:hypothetical protein